MPRIALSNKISGASKLASATSDGFLDAVLDIDLIHPSHDNFYPVEGIEQLADNMLDVGHIEPLILANVGDDFKLVSGHRRYFAIIKNIERGHDSFRKVRCSVKKMSQAMYMFTLASANAFNRKLDDATLLQQAEVMESALDELVKSGELDIEGKKRDYMASVLGVSSTKMAQIHKINTSLVEEGREALAEGKINFSKAYETSRLEPERQRLVVQDESLLSADVKSMVKDIRIQASVAMEPAETVLELEETPEDIVTHIPLAKTDDTPIYVDFLNSYRDWGVWFEEPRLGAVYYKYECGDRRVIAVDYSHPKDTRLHFVQKDELFSGQSWGMSDYGIYEKVRQYVGQALTGKE